MHSPRHLTLLVLLSFLLPSAVLCDERTWNSVETHAARGQFVQFAAQNATHRRDNSAASDVQNDILNDAASVGGRTYLFTVSTNAKPRRIVLLENVHEDVDRFGPVVNMDIPRELVRQMILMSARDDFGLATRDATLRETSAAADSSNVIRLRILVAPGLENGILRIRLWHVTDERRRYERGQSTKTCSGVKTIATT